MTSKLHTRASTRTSEALEIICSHYNLDIKNIIMVQGDEPTLLPETISQALLELIKNNVSVSNVMCQFTNQDYFKDKNNIKVVVDKNKDALYFSRSTIPFGANIKITPCYMQTGIIGFSKEALLKFNQTNETMLEKTESIDMNRIIENGEKVKMVLSNSFNISVDTQEELHIVEKQMKTDSLLLEYT